MTALDRWCCPNCGTVNEATPGEEEGCAVQGWCQSLVCSARRGRLLRRVGVAAFDRLCVPEILHAEYRGVEA